MTPCGSTALSIIPAPTPTPTPNPSAGTARGRHDSPMKVEQQPAYVLHARPFSETSLLVDFFTREHGRLMLMAKGARRGASKSRGRSRGVLLPFRPLLASWAGKGPLPTLTSVEQRGPATTLEGPPLASGFYLNELLLRLLHRHDAHETLFEHYHQAVKQLADAQPPRPVLRIFEKNLLQHIGFGPVLDHDADTGEAITAEGQYHYILEKGPVRVAPSAAEPALKISGSTLHALREERFHADNDLREAQRLTRTLIEHQLNGRPLRSRRVVREMNQYGVRG